MKQVKFTFLLITAFLTRYINKISEPLKHRPAWDPQKVSWTYERSSVRKRYIFLIILTIFMAFLGVKYTSQLRSRTTVSEGVVGVYTKKNLPPLVANLISEPLISLDKSGNPKPHLVLSWQVNNNATVYTFKLKKDLYWNDGSRVKSSDIKFDIRDVEVSYPDDGTIEFKLADSFSAFPSLLTTPILKNQELVGVGKYQVVDLNTSRNLITKLTLKPKGSNKDQFLPNVIIRFYPDERTAKIAFKLGEVDSLMAILDLGEFKNQPYAISKKITDFNKLVAIFYNYSDAILSDKNFRKALSAASPVVEGEAQAKTSLPSFSWAFNDQLKELPGNKDLAKSYLKKVQNGADSTIILTTVPALSFVGEKIVESWKEIGVSAVLRIESGYPQNFQALLTSQSIPSDPDQYALWHSTQTNTNLSKYNSQRADKDLEDGRKIADHEKRKEKYLDFQKTVNEDAPATFLYFPKTNIIYRRTSEQNINKVLPLQIPQN